MSDALSQEDRQRDIAPLLAAGWTMIEGRDGIEKEFIFKDFITAFGWMTKVAIWAEKLDHHPEWSNVYRKVQVVLISHDINGLSHRVVKMANKMDQLAG